MPADIDPICEGVFGQQEEIEVRVAPPRVLVVTEMVCCLPREDFEPQGILLAARFQPHVLVVSNLGARRVVSATELVRPPISSHAGHGMSMPNMLPELKAGLWTDTNVSPTRVNNLQILVDWITSAGGSGGLIPPSPLWDNIFDYYDTDPPVATSFDAAYSRVGPDRVASKAIVRELAPPSHKINVLRIDFRTVPFANIPYPDLRMEPGTIRKLPGQGEFDNIHIASRMTLPSITPLPLAMAPVCAHDCFHLHWRWSENFATNPSLSRDPRSVLGFSDSFVPYSTPGAPLVPPNQAIRLSLLAAGAAHAHGLRYEATVGRPIRAGKWQAILHHGAAYAWAITNHFDAAVNMVLREWRAISALPLTPIPPPPTGTFAANMTDPELFAAFYWFVRFQPLPHLVSVVPPSIVRRDVERIQILDLAGARAL
jgi:hypothetical protein